MRGPSEGLRKQIPRFARDDNFGGADDDLRAADDNVGGADDNLRGAAHDSSELSGLRGSRSHLGLYRVIEINLMNGGVDLYTFSSDVLQIGMRSTG